MKLRYSIFAAAVAALLSGLLVAQAQVPGVNSTLTSVFTLAYDNSTMKPTYSGTGYTTVVASPTDICLLNGSATKTVKVRRVILGGIATNVGSFPIAIVKRSTANSGGTPAAVTEVPYDSVNSLTPTVANAATAAMITYTTNPTTGTSVGVVADPMLTFNNATTGISGNSMLEYRFGQLGSPIVLRGVAQGLAVNGNAVSITGGILQCTFEWTEE